MTNSQFRSDVRADIRKDIGGHCCSRCGTWDLKDGWVLRFGSLYCLTCRMEQNYAAKMEEADDRMSDE